MTSLLFLVPTALLLGGLALACLLWAMRSGQFDDLDGAANRILFDDVDTVAGPRAGSETKKRHAASRHGVHHSD